MKTSQQVVKSNLFIRFLEETLSWKNHFEFVWPLEPYLQLKCLIYEQNLLSKVLNWHDISPFERNDFHMQNRNVIVLSSSPFCCHPSTKLLTFPGYQHIIALGLFLWSRIQYFSFFIYSHELNYIGATTCFIIRQLNWNLICFQLLWEIKTNWTIQTTLGLIEYEGQNWGAKLRSKI